MNQIKLKRIGSEINQILCEIVLEEAHDSLLHSITITGVEVTNDLGLARVFFTSTMDMDHKQIEKNLTNEHRTSKRQTICFIYLRRRNISPCKRTGQSDEY